MPRGVPIKSHHRQLSASLPLNNSPLSKSFGPEDQPPTAEDVPESKPSTQHGSASSIKTHHRRRSSAALLSSTPSLSGSYVTSLLSGRMASASALPVNFILRLGVNGLPPHCPPSLRGPPHLRIPFEARWHELEGPYSGLASIVDYYSSLTPAPPTLADLQSDDSAHPAVSTSSQRLYGYRIPPKGKLQLVIAFAGDDSQTASDVAPLKYFLVPYDLLGMKHGEQTIYRQVWNSHPDQRREDTLPNSSTSIASARETLRYAIELHFVSPPLKSSRKRPSRSSLPAPTMASLPTTVDDALPFDIEIDVEPGPSLPQHTRAPSLEESAHSSEKEPARVSRPKIYLSSSIRLAFASHPPETDEVVTSTIEWGGTGFGGPTKDAKPVYFPYSGPS